MTPRRKIGPLSLFDSKSSYVLFTFIVLVFLALVVAFVRCVPHVHGCRLFCFRVVLDAWLAEEIGALLTDPGFGCHTGLESWVACLAGVVFLGAGAKPGFHVVPSARKNVLVHFGVHTFVDFAIGFDCAGHLLLLLLLGDHAVDRVARVVLHDDLVAGLANLGFGPDCLVVGGHDHLLFAHASSHV